MGLDMFAFAVPRCDAIRQVDLVVGNNAVALHYWRKHSKLHSWIAQLYYEKGGAEEIFNLVSVELTTADLDRLAQAIRARTFVADRDTADGLRFAAIADDLRFVAKARDALADGLAVYYASSW